MQHFRHLAITSRKSYSTFDGLWAQREQVVGMIGISQLAHAKQVDIARLTSFFHSCMPNMILLKQHNPVQRQPFFIPAR